MRTRVGGQYGTHALTLLLGDEMFQMGRDAHLQRLYALILLLSKAPSGIGVTIRKGQIGLDVQDGCAIHQVGSIHTDDRSLTGVEVDGQDAYAGQADVVGTERTARGPYTHAPVATQTGRTNGGTPRLAVMRLAEIPQKPDVTETLEASQGFGIAKLRGEDDAGRQTNDQAALTGDSKLGGEVGVDVCNDFHDRESNQVRLLCRNRNI